MNRPLGRLVAAVCAGLALTALSGQLEVGAGTGLAVLALWWILTGGVHARIERIERRPARRKGRP